MDTPFKPRTEFKNILADTLTPVGIYLRLRDNFPGSLLLESNEYGQRSNSYSFICCNPISSFILTQEQLEIQLPDDSIQTQPVDSNFDLIHALETYKNLFTATDHQFNFPCQGLFGYLGYDAVQYFEDLE
ncbi:MAG: anthranilate synthase component I family protein, partial [Nonlabens sp.]